MRFILLVLLSVLLAHSPALAQQASTSEGPALVGSSPVKVDASPTRPKVPSQQRPADDGQRLVSKASVLVGSLTVFLLAVFVGFEVITKVPPTLHTPLMSGSNAISGITIVGAMLMAGSSAGWFGSLLGLVAVVLAMINVVGGFLVTHRMLMMFKKR